MTRKEEIAKAAEERYYCLLVHRTCFETGAAWADANPNSSWKERLKLEKEEWILIN